MKPEGDIIRTVQLKLLPLWHQKIIPLLELETLKNSARLEARLHEVLAGMALELRAHIPYVGLDEIRYPADWWQAVKERWAPAWFRRRWPVRYRVLEATALYPSAQLPDLPDRLGMALIKFLDRPICVEDWP